MFVPDRATAFHEAAHAIIAVSQGIEVVRISIRPEPERHSLGYCRLGKVIWSTRELELPIFERLRLELERKARVHLAGPIAEERYQGTAWDAEACKTDFARAKEKAAALAGYHGKGLDGVLAELRVETAVIVDDRWGLIRTLANELVRACHTKVSNPFLLPA